MGSTFTGSVKTKTFKVKVSADPTPLDESNFELPSQPEVPDDEETSPKDLLITLAEIAHKVGGCLAGGCLRDYFLGVGIPKDFDIFVLGDKDSEVPDLSEYFGEGKSFAFGETKRVREEVTGIVKYYGADVDVVVVDKPTLKDAVYTFDSSICKIWTEQREEGIVLMVSRDFLRYPLIGSWYLYKDVDTTEDHVSRLVSKFGSFYDKNTDDSSPVCLGLLEELEADNFDIKALAAYLVP